MLAILPQNHHLAKKEKLSVSDLCSDDFLMLASDKNNDVSAVFKNTVFSPNVRYATWDDYAIMSMVENELGISILPELILKRIPYNIVIKELEAPVYRNIAFAV